MPDLEALGDAAAGGVIGRAVEPQAGEGDGHTQEKACLNCGSELVGEYCHACGQKAHVHRTLSAFWHDLLHGVLHFEGKIWRTLPFLFWQPGRLTRDYIEGKRASFVSPMALFLFSVFLMFAAASFTGGLSPAITGADAKREIAAEIAKDEARLAQVRKLRDAARQAGRETAAYDEKISDLQSEIAVERGLTTGDFVPDRRSVQADGLPPWLRGPIERAGKNPELLFYKLKTNAYKLSWVLIPLSVPFLWLLFPFSRRFRLYDHMVFVTYSLSFMSMLAVLSMLMGAIGLSSLASLLLLVPPFHMYRQLRGAYGLTRFGALWRAFALTIFAFVAAGLFLALLFAVGILD